MPSIVFPDKIKQSNKAFESCFDSLPNVSLT